MGKEFHIQKENDSIKKHSQFIIPSSPPLQKKNSFSKPTKKFLWRSLKMQGNQDVFESGASFIVTLFLVVGNTVEIVHYILPQKTNE